MDSCQIQKKKNNNNKNYLGKYDIIEVNIFIKLEKNKIDNINMWLMRLDMNS